MKNYLAILGAAIVAGNSGCNSQINREQKQEPAKPNIIIMLLDDAGYNDFGFMGSPDIKTPHIDNLAANSVVFTDAHVSATVCGPSRAGLITGRYQQRFGFECNPPSPPESFGLDNSETTIADAMKVAGYKTAAFGKWHLGYQPGQKPNERGFDYYWGFLSGGRNYFINNEDDRQGEINSIRENDEFTTFDGYLTDVLGDRLIDYIDENKGRPFFVYWAPNTPHTPMQATDEDMEMFAGHTRQVFAAMMWSLDRTVGNIIAKLEEEGILDNTLIFFLSDNGGAHNNQSSNYPLKGWKGNKYEAGSRVPFFVHWPKAFGGQRRFHGLTSSLDIFATCAEVAGVSESLPNPLDGKSLMPFLTGKKEGNPHEQLFFRKDKMASTRKGDFKLIRVDSLGTRLYNIAEDLSEMNDLSKELSEIHDNLMRDLVQWESRMMNPLWLEDNRWNLVTWMIHEDLFNNQAIRVKEPAHLNRRP